MKTKTKFKVGDKVIGTSDSVYTITRKGWRGYVTGIVKDSSVDDIKVTGGFDVNSKYFRKPTPVELKKYSSKGSESLKSGDWVKVTKGGDYGLEKGMLAVVATEIESDESGWASGDDVYVPVVFNTSDGDSGTSRTLQGNLVKVSPPQFVVVWSTEYKDPTMHFHTLKEAKAFVATLKKRKGEHRAAVEIGIYKRQ